MSQNEAIWLFTLATFLQLHPGVDRTHLKEAEWQETAVWALGSLHGSCLPQPCFSTPASRKLGSSEARLSLEASQTPRGSSPPGVSESQSQPASWWAFLAKDCSHLSITRHSQHLTLPSECTPRDYCKVAERDPEKDNRGRPQFLRWLYKIVKWWYSHSNSKALVKNKIFLYWMSSTQYFYDTVILIHRWCPWRVFFFWWSDSIISGLKMVTFSVVIWLLSHIWLFVTLMGRLRQGYWRG